MTHQVTANNCSDFALPPYYVIKNCILVAGALDNWDDADIWRLTAEHSYDRNHRIALEEQDEASLLALQDLREELDELEEFREEDILEDMKSMFPDEVPDRAYWNSDEDEDTGGWEHEEENPGEDKVDNMAESEDQEPSAGSETQAQSLSLPIRNAGKDFKDVHVDSSDPELPPCQTV